MELRELLSHLGRRLWLLVILPLAALLVVIGLNAPNGTKYSSSVDLRVVNPTGDQTVAAINLVAGSLVNAATSDAVVTKLAQAGGATEQRITDGLSASRIADTELVRVTFADPDQDVVKKVAAAIPAAVQEQTFAPALRQAELAETEAQKQLETALDDLDKVRKETGLNDPDREYQTAASAVTQLKVALATAKGRPDTTTTRYLDAELKDAEADLKKIVANEPKFVGPQYAVDNARQQLAGRSSAIADINARQAATISESIGAEAAPLAWYTNLARQALTAMIIGLAVALLLLALPEVLRRSHREQEEEIYEPVTEEVAWEQQGAIAPRGPRGSGSTRADSPLVTEVPAPPVEATVPVTPPRPHPSTETTAPRPDTIPPPPDRTIPRSQFGSGVTLTKPGD
ncbi:MAG: hypothetical protein V9G19_22830 [Tetrasphaera sp.]